MASGRGHEHLLRDLMEGGMSQTLHRKRVHRSALRRRLTLWLILTGIIALAIVAAFLFFDSGTSLNEGSIRSAWHSMMMLSRDSLERAAATGPQKLIYPYSIVAGGVHDTRQLREAMETDPVAAEHYSGFDVAKARVVRLQHDEYAYVSFRVGNGVYWTSHRLKLSKGEALLTDGEHYIRTRCGNRVSQTAQRPIYKHEPTPEILDTAMSIDPDGQIVALAAQVPAGALPGAPGLENQFIAPSGGPGQAASTPSGGPNGFIPFFPAPAGCKHSDSKKNCGDTEISPPPPTPTPENSGLIFMITGAALLGLFGLRRARVAFAK